jgi:predicted DNA-binding transcriptional regulator AlpA
VLSRFGWTMAQTEIAPTTAAEAEFLTDAELCKRVHVTSQTTWRWRRDGGGPLFVRVGQHRILYRVSDVDDWLRARIYTHRAAEAVSRC